MLLLLMVGFFMTTRGGANAFPIFCSDIKPYNESMLTNGDEDDFMPDGVGIGKRWRF